MFFCLVYFFFSSRRRHTRYWRDWSSDVCSSDLGQHAGLRGRDPDQCGLDRRRDRKSTRLNSSHANISYAVFCLKKKKKTDETLLIKKKNNIKKIILISITQQ